MCDYDNHDFTVAGVQRGLLIAICRWCGQEKRYPISSDFKIDKNIIIPLPEHE